MRRPRHKLQVSTFPFLAVLLGAMGALILLLLVMDRRSKLVARARALEAHNALVAARVKSRDLHVANDEAGRAEWELKRRNLHNLLDRQQQELAQERQDLETRLRALNHDMGRETETLLGLEKSILAERARLDVKNQLLAQMREGIARTGKLDTASQAEVERLAGDLADLERALQEAKALKTQEQETYSLVPYRGTLGQGRRPVYVECAPAGLIFHPGEWTLANADFDIRAFRNEVERRGIELIREQRDPERPRRPPQPKTSDKPYVLFLVRPNGLESYYNATSALRGFDLDFGYELIDAQWALDFTRGTGMADKQARQQDPVRPPRSPPALKGSYPLENYASAQAGPGAGSGLGPPVGGNPGGGADPGQTGTVSAAPVNMGYSPKIAGPPDRIGIVPTFTTAPPGVNTPGATAAVNAPFGKAGLGNGAAGPSLSGQNLPGSPRGPDLTASLARPEPSSGSDKMGAAPIRAGSAPNQPGAPGNGSQNPTVDAPQDVAWRGRSASVNGGSPGGAERSQGTASPGLREGLDPKGIYGPVSDGAERSQATVSGLREGTDPKGSNGPVSDGAERSQGTVSGLREGTDPKGSGPAESSDPLARLAPRPPLGDSGAVPKKLTPAPSVGRLWANRDYVLTIECFGDAVALYPGSQVFTMANRPEQNTDQALVKAVLQSIARRQATVRSGETPYRPMLRFQVHPEALRTYFHVYPLFESLHIPMTRENLDS